MKFVYKWATISTLLITVVLFLFLVFFVEKDEIVIFAVLSGVIASMIVMAISNCISWLLFIGQEKILLRNKYTETIDTYSDSLHVIKYALSDKNGIPGVSELISKYQELFNQFQRLFILHNRDKMPDYFKLKKSVEAISMTMKKINNSHKVIKKDQEILAAYQDILTFISDDKELDSFVMEVVKLQHDSIIEQNKSSST